MGKLPITKQSTLVDLESDPRAPTEWQAFRKYQIEQYKLNWELGLHDFDPEKQLLLLEKFAARWGPMVGPDLQKCMTRIKQHKLRSLLVPFGEDWAKTTHCVLTPTRKKTQQP